MISFRQASKKQSNLNYFEIPRFENLTYLINGIRENELITISARVGCGKTTLALNLFTELARENKCGYISYEMNTKELVDKIYQFCDTPNQDNMGFDDDCGVFSTDLMEQYIKKYHFKFIFIDYLQLMLGNIKKNTRALKEICRKYNVVIFMLAQLNRKGENVEPQLSMLKDSGTIEQDSDEVGFIKPHTIKVAKNRKSDIGEIDIVFDKPNSYFYENSGYRETKNKLITDFENLCWDYLREKKIKEKILVGWVEKIDKYLDDKVLPFDTELYDNLKDILIQVINSKTKIIKTGCAGSTNIGVENVKLL